MGQIKQYLTLIRPYGMLFLGFMPVFGALCNGQFSLFPLLVLLLIGLLTHVFTFVQNDYYDVEVDRQSNNVKNRPLVLGGIPRAHALILFTASFVISIVLSVIFLFSVSSILLLLSTYLLITLYNLYSKRTAGMEYILGLGVLSLGIFGGYTVSDNLSLLVLIISVIGMFQWVFSVGVSANLKDVQSDTDLGIRTTPVLLGVYVQNKDLEKPVIFLGYAIGIKLLHLGVAALPFFLGYTSITVYGLAIPLLIYLILAGILLYTAVKILTISLKKRDTLLRFEGVHEGFALLLIPIVLLNYMVDHIGVVASVLLCILLLVWPLLSLRTLFGETLIPLE